MGLPAPIFGGVVNVTDTPIVWKITAAALVLTAGFAAAGMAETRDEAWARERCTKDGYKPNTAGMDGCIRYTVAWLEKSRRDAQRNFQ